MLSKEVCQSIDDSVLCWLATSGRSNIPNVSPKEIFTYFEEGVIIANIASPCSASNISKNPIACVSFIDIFTQKGYKVTGHASILPYTTSLLKTAVAKLKDMAGVNFTIHNFIVIKADRVDKILAPSYQFFSDTTEQSQREAAYKAYNVSPKKKAQP